MKFIYDDDARWEELKRKVESGKSFGTNVRLISAAEAKEKFPLLQEDSMSYQIKNFIELVVISLLRLMLG